MRVLVIAPTFQEAENVTRFLTEVRASVPTADILVVDDHSPDGTGALAEQAAAELGQIKVLHRPGKEGLGSAYRQGFEVALDEDYEIIVQMDVDFSHEPAAIPRLIARLDAGADAAIGSRYVAGGATVDWPLYRRLLSKWGNRYTAFVLRLPLSDVTSGFRAYRADSLRAIEPGTTTAEGYAFLTELARRLVRRNARIDEVAITFADRTAGQSKMSGSIIRESMMLVTRWGLRDLFRR